MIERLYLNIWTILGSAVIIVMSGHAFIKGGIPGVDVFTMLFTLALPFATFLTAFMLLRHYTMQVIAQKSEWYLNLVPLVIFGGMFALGLYETARGPTFDKIYQSTYIIGVGGLGMIKTLTALSVWFRVFRARSPRSALIMVFLCIAVLSTSPLVFIYPPLNDLGQFISMSVVAGGNACYEVAAFLGISAMIARVFIGKEKLTPGTELGAAVGAGE
jgi:hypothetical protein